jgi:uncharacterized membrane protein (DUF2068 family)
LRSGLAGGVPHGYAFHVDSPAPRLEGGVRLIVAYKLARAVISFAGAVALGILFASHRLEAMHALAHRLLEHSTTATAIALAKFLLSALEPKHIVIGITALVLDAIVLVIEGWSLLHGKRWGAWVVVAASGSPVPFEIASLVKHFAVGRVAVLVVNVTIVAYLLARAWRMHHPAAAL